MLKNTVHRTSLRNIINIIYEKTYWTEGAEEMENTVMSARKAALFLGLHVQTLRDWADRGRVPHEMNHRGWRLFRISDLERLKQDLEAQKGNARLN